jgi:hypothetical protein
MGIQERVAGRDFDQQIDRLLGHNGVGWCPKCGSTQVSEGLLTPGIGCSRCGWVWLFVDGARLAPHYSTEITAAWLVVEHLLTIIPQEDIHMEHLAGGGWKVGSCHEVGQLTDWVEADTAPLAICRAALAAVGA